MNHPKRPAKLAERVNQVLDRSGYPRSLLTHFIHWKSARRYHLGLDNMTGLLVRGMGKLPATWCVTSTMGS